MQVGNALAAILAVVDNKPEAFISPCKPEVTGNFSGYEEQVPQRVALIIIGLTNSGYCFFRDDQDVLRGLWIDIPEGDRVVILVDNVRRNLARYDSLEQCGY